MPTPPEWHSPDGLRHFYMLTLHLLAFILLYSDLSFFVFLKGSGPIGDLCFPAQGFSCGSDGKESACNSGDPGLIPGSGRSPAEGNNYPLQYSSRKIPWTEEPGVLGYSSWDHKESDTAE